MRGIRRGTVIAAGALIWRIKDDKLQVLAVHRPSYDDWSWPKGKLHRGETIVECAVREVFEETGKQVVLGQPLPTLTYTISSGREKTVKYWAAHTIDTGSAVLRARPPWKLASKKEVDRTKWFTVEEARERITMKADLKPLEALVSAHKKGRLVTRSFVLARHARARKRSSWRFEDIARPITAGGNRRAHQLVQLFSGFGARHVHSSPATRCLATVQPYAAKIEKKVKTYEEFTEDTHAWDPEATAARLEKLFAKGGNQLVCVHRPTMPTMLGILNDHTRKWTKGKVPSKNPYLPAGGVLVAHVVDTDEGPMVAAFERHFLK